MNQEQIYDVTEATFSEEIEQAELPVFIDFWAPWCGPCKLIQPTLDELAKVYQGRVKFAKINADDNKALAERFAVRGLPTLLLLKAGEVVDRAVGIDPLRGKSQFVDLLDKHVATKSLQPSKSWRAFHGDATLKGMVIERVRAHIEAGQIESVDFFSHAWPLCDEYNGRYNLCGAALHGTDIEEYETAFGIPSSAAMLEDSVHDLLIQTSTDEQGTIRHAFSQSARDYPLNWLEGIPLGADLRNVTPHFLQWLLSGLIDSPLPFGASVADNIKAVLREVALLHARWADGDEPSTSQWKAARDAAAKITSSYEDDPISWGLATCAEKFAWPVEALGLSMRHGIGILFSGLRRAAIQHGYSAEEWARRQAVIATARARREAEPKAGKDVVESWEETKAMSVLLNEAAPVDAALWQDLRFALGRSWHMGLMQSLATVVRQGAE
jgi:thioredoxin